MSVGILLLAVALLVGGCEVRRAAPDGPDERPVPEADTLERRAALRPTPDPLGLRLPTENDALYSDPSRFYAALDRETIPGLRGAGWEGGQYGFVRSPARVGEHLILSQLHEGLDIRPLRRDGRGEPLDSVFAVAGGEVVYENEVAGRSAYGKYVVVRHVWDETPVYSLYAHLSDLAVAEGDSVSVGESLGQLGYTGRGTARHRAHVHLEIGLLLTEHFQAWFDRYYGTRNFHGIYFGTNIAGVDAAELYRAYRADSSVSFASFVRAQPVAYRLALPGDRPLDVLERYPWLAADGVTPADTTRTGAWVVSFTQEGVPVRIARRPQPVEEPEVVYVADRIRTGRLSTAGRLVLGSDRYRLTRDGRAYAALLATSARGVPPWF